MDQDKVQKLQEQSTSTMLDWNQRSIGPFKSMLTQSGETMFAIRLYVCALTFAFLFLVAMDRGVGFLEGVVITCALVYLILDVREDLKVLKADLRQLERLEQQLAVLLSD